MDGKNIEELFKSSSNGNIIKLVEILSLYNTTEEIKNVLKTRDKKGRQAIHVASKRGRVRCLIELVKCGADIEEKCLKGNNALHYACISATLPCIVVLLEMGGNLRTQNIDGKTALDLIPESKQSVIGCLLRETEKRREMSSEQVSPSFDDETFLKKLCGNIPIIPEKNIEINFQLELSRGPEMSYCGGKFNSLPVMVKYKTDINKRGKDENNRLKQQRQSLSYTLKDELIAFRSLGNHTSILQLLGVVCNEHGIQLVFELPSLGCLHRVLFQSKLKLNSNEILGIARDISNALRYIHGKGYLHCAVTTYSITLSKSLAAKICNLNYVQKTNEATSISHIPCLYPYLATSQRKGYPSDQSNDIYGLGVVLYECITMRTITDIEAEMQTQHNKLKLKQISKTFDRSVVTLIESCMSFLSSKRPTSLQTYEWLDATIEGRLTSLTPKNMESEELSPLRLV